MLTLALLVHHVAVAETVASPTWPTEWGRVRVQASLTGEKEPDELNLKWRSSSIRVDGSLHDAFGIWTAVQHTRGAGRADQRVGGYAISGGFRTSTWISGPFGLGLQGLVELGEDWTTAASGSIEDRTSSITVAGLPSILLGNEYAHTWIAARLGTSRSSNLFDETPTPTWDGVGLRGWQIGAELRSDDLNAPGASPHIRTFVGLALNRIDAEFNVALWSGVAF